LCRLGSIPGGVERFSLPKCPYQNWGPPSLPPNSTRWPRRERNHSHSLYAVVKNEWMYTSNSHHALIAWKVALILFADVMYCMLVFPTSRCYVIYSCWHACQYTAHASAIDDKVVHMLGKEIFRYYKVSNKLNAVTLRRILYNVIYDVKNHVSENSKKKEGPCHFLLKHSYHK
jgi:hypothetical protein